MPSRSEPVPCTLGQPILRPRDWALADPDGRSPDEVAAVRDDIEARVDDLFDELAGDD